MPRFIPAGSPELSAVPQGGNRFIPASAAQLPTAPQGDPSGGGIMDNLNPAQALGFAKSGLGVLGTAGRFLEVPGASYAAPLGSVLGLGQGIATGDPRQIAQGTYNTGMDALKLADKFGVLGGGAAGGLGLSGAELAASVPGGFSLFGAGGAGAGLTGSELMGAVPSLGLWGAEAAGPVAAGAEALASGVGAGGLAGAGAGAAGAAGAEAGTIGLGAALSGLSTVMAPIAAIAAIAFMNQQHQEQKRIENQTQESGVIRQQYASAVPSLLSAVQAAKQAMTLQGLPPDQQQAMLATILPQLEAGIGTISPITRFISTQGQGGGGSLTKPADTSQAQAGFPPAIQETMLGYLYASDAAARMGMPVEQIPGQGRDPAAIMNTLMQGTFNPYLQNIDYSQVGPGNQVDFVRQQLEAADPNFAASALGQQLAALPAVPGTFDPAAAQQAALERQQTAEMQIQNVIGQQQGTDLDAVAYAAPYAGGLEENLMSLIPRTMPQEEGLAIIQDLLSRGASPVLIRSGLQERAEQRGYF